MKAQRKYSSSESVNPPSTHSLLDGLNVVLPSAAKPRKTKRDGSPTWDQLHAPFRYDLTDPNLYYRIAGIATELNVPNISSVAEQLLDFALAEYLGGKISIEPRPNPNPKSTKMVLTWKTDGRPREVKPDYERKKQKPKIISSAKKRPPFGFRWGRVRHDQVKAMAQEHNCTIGAMTTRLLTHAVDAYRAGQFRIEVEYVAVANVKGWGLK